MTEEDLKKKLKALASIEPDAKYTKRSRFIILSSKESVVFRPRLREGIFSRSVQVFLSTALAVVFFLVLALGNNAGSLKTFFLPSLQGVDNESLTTEADTIISDIDIKLSEIEYFDKSVALADGQNPVEGFATSEEEIDRILDQVIDY